MPPKQTRKGKKTKKGKSKETTEDWQMEDVLDDVKASDSISRVGARSSTSAISASNARRIELLANRAQLKARLLAERERQEIELKELRLKQRGSEMDTKKELLALQTEDKVLKECGESGRRSWLC